MPPSSSFLALMVQSTVLNTNGMCCMSNFTTARPNASDFIALEMHPPASPPEGKVRDPGSGKAVLLCQPSSKICRRQLFQSSPTGSAWRTDDIPDHLKQVSIRKILLCSAASAGCFKFGKKSGESHLLVIICKASLSYGQGYGDMRQPLQPWTTSITNSRRVLTKAFYNHFQMLGCGILLLRHQENHGEGSTIPESWQTLYSL